jgi:DNA-binding XRE family transcriptional regulator
MSDFDDLIHFIEEEAQAEGPDAVAERQAFDARFRIAAELLEARRQAHMTQRDLAKESGIQQAEISKIERGEITPGVTTVDRLLRPLGRRLAVVANDARS